MQIEAGLYRVLLPWRAHLPAMLRRLPSSRETLSWLRAIHCESPRERLRAQVLGAGHSAAKLCDGSNHRPGNGPHRQPGFGANLENVQEGFSYQVTTDGGNSAWYAVTVQSRPAVSGIDLNYQYPPYTRQVSKADVGSDGSIDAIVGTKVLVTVHASEPLSTESRIILDKERRRNRLPP